MANIYCVGNSRPSGSKYAKWELLKTPQEVGSRCVSTSDVMFVNVHDVDPSLNDVIASCAKFMTVIRVKGGAEYVHKI